MTDSQNSYKHLQKRICYDSELIKIFTIDLDYPVQDQMASILKQFKPQVEEYIEYLKSFEKVNYVKENYEKFLENQSIDFQNEVKFISEAMEIQLPDLMIWAACYELFSGCTTIVLENEENKILFAKNLDYYGYDLLQKIAFKIEYKRGNVVEYGCFQLAGYPGYSYGYNFKTGVKISLNQRNNKDFKHSLEKFIKGLIPPCYLIKKTIEEYKNYEESVEILQKTEICSNCYFIVGGDQHNQGIAIARDSDPKLNKIDQLCVEKGKWFLVQTNYDLDENDIEYDYRRIPAEDKIIQIGRKINSQDLFKIACEFPTNNIMTISTSIILDEDHTITWKSY